MTNASQYSAPEMSWRLRLMRIFLWISVLGWGIGLGAKLFDLLVVAGAWSAAPPASFALLPYGPHFPINPGDFFQPLSGVMVLGILGALISGWKAPLWLRLWLWLPVSCFSFFGRLDRPVLGPCALSIFVSLPDILRISTTRRELLVA